MSDVFDPKWVSRHLDAEMSYAVQGTIESLPKALSWRKFSEALAEVVTGVMHERVPAAAGFYNASDLAPISLRVFGARGGTEWFFNVPRDEAAHDLCFAWLTYIHALRLGAPSPRARRESFNPFANEGGFCNPRKLKMLDD